MFSLLRERNILVLTLSQILFWTTLMLGISVSALVGQTLAENKALATLPAGFLALSAIIVTRPASIMMQKTGRRFGFILGALSGIVGCIVSAYAIFQGSFELFCLGNILIGPFQAIGLYHRLAAADSVPAEKNSQAIAMVMAGGIVAALVTPTLLVWSKQLYDPFIFAGNFVVLAFLNVFLVLLLLFFSEDKKTEAQESGGGRPLGEIIRQPMFIVAVINAGFAQGIMVLIMLATPLAMVACGFADNDAAYAVRWHFLSMFIPSFFSGPLISRFGAPKIALVGAGLFVLSIATAAAGINYLNFSFALIFLGVGWNFMYVAGTTMITLSHTPEERGRVQGTAEMIVLSVSTVAAFSSGGLLSGVGWQAVNFGAVPLLLIAVFMTWRFARQSSMEAKSA